MIGNYTYKPKNATAIEISDIEEFILGLLKDVCSGSSNALLQNAKVNYEGDLNLSDVQENFVDTKLLVSFWLADKDQRNQNLKNQLGNCSDIIKVAYEIGIIAKKDQVSSIDLKRAFEEIINGLTFNHNSTVSNTANYQATLSNGKVLNSPLTLNIADNIPEYMQKGENQINYLTAITNVLFIVGK